MSCKKPLGDQVAVGTLQGRRRLIPRLKETLMDELTPYAKDSDKSAFSKIDYRSSSERKIDGARTKKANILLTATMVAIVVCITCIFIWA